MSSRKAGEIIIIIIIIIIITSYALNWSPRAQ